MKFVVWENGRNTVKILLRPRSVHHETHMEGLRRELGTPAVGGERLTACATRLPYCFFILMFLFYLFIILPSGGRSVPFVHPRKYAPDPIQEKRCNGQS